MDQSLNKESGDGTDTNWDINDAYIYDSYQGQLLIYRLQQGQLFNCWVPAALHYNNVETRSNWLGKNKIGKSTTHLTSGVIDDRQAGSVKSLASQKGGTRGGAETRQNKGKEKQRENQE